LILTPDSACLGRHLNVFLCAARLLTKAGRTLTEEKMRRVMQRVANRSRRPDIKVMALFIREKLAGSGRGMLWQQGAKISPDLDVLPPEDAAATRMLSQCKCPMTRGMHCRCGAARRDVHMGGSGRKRPISAPKGKPGRRKYGSLNLDPQHVAAKVEEMGGLAVIEGQQGRKGGGWKTVAAALGVDVEVFRDCGFQMKKLYWETQPRGDASNSGGGSSQLSEDVTLTGSLRKRNSPCR
jgi:hypothetical protein